LGKSFITDVPDVKVYELTENDQAGTNFHYVKRGTKFTVIELLDGGNIVRFWNYPDSSGSVGKNNVSVKDMKLLIGNNFNRADLKALRSNILNAQSLDKNNNSIIDGTDAQALLPAGVSLKTEDLTKMADKLSDMSGFNKPSATSDFDTVADVINYKGLGAYINNKANGKHFIMKPNDFNTKVSLYNTSRFDFSWGAATIPLKLRFGNGDSTQFSVAPTINLGLFVGGRYQITSRKKQGINVLLGASGTSVTFKKEDLENQVEEPEPDNAFALSIPVGIVYQYENFQVGVFAGWDFIPYELGRRWRHQGEAWLGVGLGIGIFSKEQAEKSSEIKRSN
jgi:hypothetical protein